MGIHTYTCPTCKSLVRVKAQAGEVVLPKDCEACEQEKGLGRFAEEVENSRAAKEVRRK